jgi:hypothetical protein
MKSKNARPSRYVTAAPSCSSFLCLYFSSLWSVVKCSRKQTLQVRPSTPERGWILFSVHVERGSPVWRCATFLRFARRCSVVRVLSVRAAAVCRVWLVMRAWSRGACVLEFLHFKENCFLLISLTGIEVRALSLEAQAKKKNVQADSSCMGTSL